jgi:hypothetical protein
MKGCRGESITRQAFTSAVAPFKWNTTNITKLQKIRVFLFVAPYSIIFGFCIDAV